MTRDPRREGHTGPDRPDTVREVHLPGPVTPQVTEGLVGVCHSQRGWSPTSPFLACTPPLGGSGWVVEGVHPRVPPHLSVSCRAGCVLSCVGDDCPPLTGGPALSIRRSRPPPCPSDTRLPPFLPPPEPPEPLPILGPRERPRRPFSPSVGHRPYRHPSLDVVYSRHRAWVP